MLVLRTESTRPRAPHPPRPRGVVISIGTLYPVTMNQVEFLLSLCASQMLLAGLWVLSAHWLFRGRYPRIIVAAGAAIPWIVTIVIGYTWILLLPGGEQPGAGMMLAMTGYLAFFLIPVSLVTGAAVWVFVSRRAAGGG